MKKYLIAVVIGIGANSEDEAVKWLHEQLVNLEDEPHYSGYREMQVLSTEEEEE